MRKQDTPQGIERDLQTMGAQFLWLVYHNFSGLGHAKVVTRERFGEVAESGVSFAKANWDFTITDRQLPDPGYGADAGDFRLVLDSGTLALLPHHKGVAQAFGWLMTEDGEPWTEGDPRARLQAMTRQLTAAGYTTLMAYEAEFVLMSRDPPDVWAPVGDGRMFTIDDLDSRWALWDQILITLEAAGVRVHQFAKEYGPGQYEISLLPADPISAADAFQLARQIIKSLARQAGLLASFMPKPAADLAGNGLHTHVSLLDATGKPALCSASDPRALSRVGRHAVAGLLTHADGQLALAAPTPNSYRRLHPGSWAPAHIAWGQGNRSALVRLPPISSGTHLEYRAGDASANPYLLATGLLAAMYDGIQNATSLPVGATGLDLGHISDRAAAAKGFNRLPGDAATALDAFESDDLLREALGVPMAEHYLSVKRYELELFGAAFNERDGSQVTAWEREAYLVSL